MGISRTSGKLNLLGVNTSGVILTEMIRIGKGAISYAIDNHEFENRTHNLEDSFAFGVYRSGALVHLGNNTKQAIEPNGYEGKLYSGYEEAGKFIRKQSPPEEWALIVVAAMPYAWDVQEIYKLDVLESSYLEAKSLSSNGFKNMKFNRV
jgi:hypothetical protein